MKLLIKLPITNILFLLILTVIVTGCNGNQIKLKDGDRHITDEIDEVISKYIIEHYSSSFTYSDTEKQFEVHKVYGTSEDNGVLSVYMWSFFGGFNQSTGTEMQSGHSLPAVIRLKKDTNHYTVIEYIEPKDGSSYASSLKKMFPEKYLKLVQQENGNIKVLQKEMDNKVKQWLEE